MSEGKPQQIMVPREAVEELLGELSGQMIVVETQAPDSVDKDEVILLLNWGVQRGAKLFPVALDEQEMSTHVADHVSENIGLDVEVKLTEVQELQDELDDLGFFDFD